MLCPDEPCNDPVSLLENDVTRPSSPPLARTLMVMAIALFGACAEGTDVERGADLLLDPEHPSWTEEAPETFAVRVETTRGDFVIEVVRSWAPIGADRFYHLVRNGFYDDVRFHRVVPGFITQWGVSGRPEVDAVWYDRGMPDDPVVASNVRGTIAYAFTDPGTRATQVYINMVDNTRLDATGFAPFGRVVEGMEAVVDSIYSGYGEESGGGVRRGDQSRIVAEGNAYLDADFPLLDRLIRAEILGGNDLRPVSPRTDRIP